MYSSAITKTILQAKQPTFGLSLRQKSVTCCGGIERIDLKAG